MISQLVVEYQLRTVKIKVTASTLIRQVREEACKRFNLDEKNYVLKYVLQ